jgi:hypothetical protein
MSRRIRLSQLLGRKVYDRAGGYAGRIEEVRARQNADGTCVVEEYLLGRQGLLERLSVVGAAGYLVSALGGYSSPASHRAPWMCIDLSNPKRPQLTCRVEELERLEA